MRRSFGFLCTILTTVMLCGSLASAQELSAPAMPAPASSLLMKADAGVAAQTTPTATVLDSAAWDYSDAMLASGAVTRFEIVFDSDAPIGIAVATATRTPGTDEYKFKLPALTAGAHTVKVRACNVSQCSGFARLDFTFGIIPQDVVNLRFVSGD